MWLGRAQPHPQRLMEALGFSRAEGEGEGATFVLPACGEGAGREVALRMAKAEIEAFLAGVNF
jgi:hypothetical protein